MTGPTDIGAVIAARGQTHGDFAELARVAQAIKAAMRSAPNWAALSDAEKEAFEMKATKLARHLCGDASEPDHLRDDIGYSTLALARCAPSPEAKRREGR